MSSLVMCVGVDTCLEEEAVGSVATSIPWLDKGTGDALGVLGLGMSKVTPRRVVPVSLEAFKGMLVAWGLAGGS